MFRRSSLTVLTFAVAFVLGMLVPNQSSSVSAQATLPPVPVQPFPPGPVPTAPPLKPEPPEAPAAPPVVRGKCIGMNVIQEEGGNGSRGPFVILRAFEDGTVEFY